MEYSSKAHICAHHQGFRFECNQCNQSFVNNQSLKNHTLVVHEGAKIKCNFCDKQFVTEYLLNSHVKSLHNLEFPRHRKSEQCYWVT